MSKPTRLVGRTEIIAAIYNADHLPTAVLSLDPNKHADPAPFCMHSLRHEDLSFFESRLLANYRTLQGKNADGSQDEEVEALLWPFFEDYPEQRHVCNGCSWSDDLEAHYIKRNEDFCTMTIEQCA